MYTTAAKRAIHRHEHVAADYMATVTYDDPSRGAESIAATHNELATAVRWARSELVRRRRGRSTGAAAVVTWRAPAGHQEVLWSSARRTGRAGPARRTEGAPAGSHAVRDDGSPVGRAAAAARPAGSPQHPLGGPLGHAGGSLGGFDELVEILKAAMQRGVSGRAALVAAEIELRLLDKS